MSKDKWLSPLDIPDGKVGNFEVRHVYREKGEVFQLANFRCQMFGGQKDEIVTYDHETRWHKLLECGSRWTSDFPCEQKQQYAAVKDFKGSVLVGGLGLGVVLHALANNPRVTEIIVVEKSIEVIDLVWNHIRTDKMDVRNEDLFDCLRNHDHEMVGYDFGFYDIWQSDGEGTFFQTVLPLHQASVGKVKHPPKCWNEDVMRGQLLSSIQMKYLQIEHPEFMPKGSVLLWEEDGSIEPWHNWSVPFFLWVHKKEPDKEEFTLIARHYCAIYGLPGWEKKWARLRKEIG